MARKKAPELKVTLDKNNSTDIRVWAQRLCSTPPKIVNRIVREWIDGEPTGIVAK